MSDKKTRRLICVHLETPDKRASALKWLSCFGAFVVMILIPFSLFAEEADQVVKHEAGFYYTIQKGDTLWDLSQRFSDSPWMWPDLWKENDQIANPHWIYPGQRIRLFHREGVEKITQTVLEEKAVQAEEVPKEPPYYLYSPIDSIGFIKPAPVTPHGTIFKVKDDKEMISQGDTVFIKPMGDTPLLPGSRYYVYRTLEPLKDEKAKTYVGVEHYMTGIVEIIKKESDFAVASVVKSFRDIVTDDLLIPFTPRSPKIVIVESQPGIEGKIIVSEEHDSIFGDGTIAFIDRGGNNGLKPGQFYTVYYQEKKSTNSLSGEDVPFTQIDFGTFLVLHTEPATSTVLITGSVKSLYPGATFHSPVPQM